MKVQEIAHVDVTQKQSDGKNVGRTEGSFDRVLNEALGEVGATREPESGTAATDPLSSVAGVPAVSLSGEVTGDAGAAESSISGAIDQLQAVEQGLLSGPVSEKQVGQAIGSLSSEAEKLRGSTQNLPSDHPLRQIADELSVLAHVEAVKYHRGDYA
jgi:hypothetical protein